MCWRDPRPLQSLTSQDEMHSFNGNMHRAVVAVGIAGLRHSPLPPGQPGSWAVAVVGQAQPSTGPARPLHSRTPLEPSFGTSHCNFWQASAHRGWLTPAYCSQPRDRPARAAWLGPSRHPGPCGRVCSFAHLIPARLPQPLRPLVLLLSHTPCRQGR